MAESRNKILINIIKKIIGDNKRSWDSKIKYALWADRTTVKRITGKSPFELVYGTLCRLPIHLELPIHQLLQDINNDQEALDSRIDQLVELDESRRNAFQQIVTQEGKTKEQFDLHARDREFKVGDTVLL